MVGEGEGEAVEVVVVVVVVVEEEVEEVVVELKVQRWWRWWRWWRPWLSLATLPRGGKLRACCQGRGWHHTVALGNAD